MIRNVSVIVILWPVRGQYAPRSSYCANGTNTTNRSKNEMASQKPLGLDVEHGQRVFAENLSFRRFIELRNRQHSRIIKVEMRKVTRVQQ